MIRIWRGDLTLATALDQGRLEAHGTTAALRALPRWLGVSVLAQVHRGARKCRLRRCCSIPTNGCFRES